MICVTKKIKSMKKNEFIGSYTGTIMSRNNGGKILVRMEASRKDDCSDYKVMETVFMLVPLPDPNTEIVVGNPVCIDISEDNGSYTVVVDIPGVSITSKLKK